MLLAIDIGNTNVTLALVVDGELVATRRSGTPRSATADELELLIAGLIGLDGRTMRTCPRSPSPPSCRR